MSFRRIDCAIGIAVTLVATGSAFAVPGWNVANIDNTTTNPSNANFINLARNPDGPFIIRNEVRPVINYGGGGQYAGDFPFLNEVALGSDQSNFLQRHTGFIQIPVSGVYSLFNQTDDPFFVSIGSNAGPVTWTDTACCGVSVNAVTLTAGTFGNCLRFLPPLVLLVTLYWVMSGVPGCGLGFAFAVGLLLDLLRGAPAGENALAFCVTANLAQLLEYRIGVLRAIGSTFFAHGFYPDKVPHRLVRVAHAQCHSSMIGKVVCFSGVNIQCSFEL